MNTRATGSIASTVVREWASRATAAGVDPAKVEGAFQIADAMDTWRAAHRGRGRIVSEPSGTLAPGISGGRGAVD